VAEIEARMAASDFWNNQEAAREVMAQLKGLKSVVMPMEESLAATQGLAELLELAEDDESAIVDIRRELDRLEAIVDEIELKSLLDGPHDGDGALVSIYARDGGTDAHDWAEMLLRMYSQWAQKNGYSASVIDREDNIEAGINRATLSIQGPMAFGYLKGETGIHRLVRISPFNSEGKRQTSFAAVDVAPDINDDIVIDIKDEDVRVDKFCASGAGGQHVNKTASAIRLTHLPTNIVVQCQNERSQHKNLALAYKMLRARMMQREEEKREAEEAAKYQNKARVGFGSQIRNYFLHPDQRVKDVRTGYSMTNFHQVMDGNIQGFLDSMLRWRVSQESPAMANDDA
jgi:peptide chain release factor 2